MSFADVGGNGSGGARQGTSAGGGGPDKFQQQSRALAGLVFQMSTQVAGFRRLVDALGSAKDTKELRTKIAQERENISRQARDANAKLKTLGREMDSVSPVATVKAVHSRLISDLQGVLKEFQRAQRLCAEKEMQFVPRDSPKPAKAAKPQRAGLLDDEDNGAETESLLQDRQRQEQQQQQALIDNELEYRQAIIEERDEGIEAIQHSIGEVNEIFQDLAVLIDQQGGQIDDIENNIVATAVRTQQANEELIKAERHQRAGRTRLCVVMSVLLIAVIIIIVTLKN